MTPKEKAKELLWKYLPILESWEENNSNKAKQCGLIAVDEILNIKSVDKDYDLSNYWEEVKQEIEKL